MLRLKVTLGKPQDRIGGVKLTPQQYIEYVRLWRQSAKTELDALVSSPAWDQLPTYAQRRMIRDTFASWRDMAEETMLSRYPDLVRTKTERQLEELRQ